MDIDGFDKDEMERRYRERRKGRERVHQMDEDFTVKLVPHQSKDSPYQDYGLPVHEDPKSSNRGFDLS